jgi:hypothetical protein
VGTVLDRPYVLLQAHRSGEPHLADTLANPLHF